uniref:Glycine amidinotransferase n=1 Tax=Trichobilharzia regenti TaxID=157069 RepID=A0AA85JRB2_TRIRE|nr:unnamed protein product [Trichobilharzia regenti]
MAVSTLCRVYRQSIKCLRSVPSVKTKTTANFYSTEIKNDHNNQSPVNSWNEWDPLEEIIVGTPEYATVPRLLPEVKPCAPTNKHDFYIQNGGKYWADVIPKEHWQLLCKQVEEFVKILELEGIKVVRPDPVDHKKSYKVLDFESQGFYAAMPRDFLLIVGDEMIEATMTWRSRYFEFLAYRPLLLNYWKQGAKWTVAPKPTDFSKLISDTPLPSNDGKVTTESEPCFDAADFIRAGRDIFAQRSQVTNLSGIEWVRRHLAPRGIKVHRLSFEDPRPMHIDATFSLVKPGIAIQNPDRPCHQTDIIRKAGWQVIDAPYPLMKKDHDMWLGSNWLSMNVLMLDPNRVIIECEEIGMQKLYKSFGVKPIPVKLRHANSIGGGFHCWTCDIRRRSKLESYFDWSKGEIPSN